MCRPMRIRTKMTEKVKLIFTSEAESVIQKQCFRANLLNEGFADEAGLQGRVVTENTVTPEARPYSRTSCKKVLPKVVNFVCRSTRVPGYTLPSSNLLELTRCESL